MILNPDELRCGIIVYPSTVKSTIASLTNIATGKSTRSPTNKLICRHKISNFQPVATNGSLRIKIRTFLTLGDLCRAQANSQDWHFGIAQEDVEVNLVFMMGGWHCNLPNGSSKIWFRIIACRRCIPLPSFQCQRSNSFWGIDKFSFFRLPTHQKLETGSCFLDNVDKFWLTDMLAK